MPVGLIVLNMPTRAYPTLEKILEDDGGKKSGMEEKKISLWETVGCKISCIS